MYTLNSDTLPLISGTVGLIREFYALLVDEIALGYIISRRAFSF